MKKKVFFILNSFSAGGAEKVFWLICQAFDKTKYKVTVVLLNQNNSAFSSDLKDVNIIYLKTNKASKSFIPLLKVIRRERPDAIFSTGGEINLLVSLVSIFSGVPNLIARGTNIPDERYKFYSIKSKIISRISTIAFGNFHHIICQSKEMFNSWAGNSLINVRKLVVIPNPVFNSQNIIKINEAMEDCKKLVIVARLSSVKGHDRLLDIFNKLPANYTLTVAGGEGGMKNSVENKIRSLSLFDRVKLVGEIADVSRVISEHNLFVLSSYTEGFPNVVLEALSVGVPVVTFRVGGVSDFIIDDFNGYIVEQGDVEGFRLSVIKACSRKWDHSAISKDIDSRFSINKVVKQYEGLITN